LALVIEWIAVESAKRGEDFLKTALRCLFAMEEAYNSALCVDASFTGW
jgi:hypothetical protein